MRIFLTRRYLFFKESIFQRRTKRQQKMTVFVYKPIHFYTSILSLKKKKNNADILKDSFFFFTRENKKQKKSSCACNFPHRHTTRSPNLDDLILTSAVIFFFFSFFSMFLFSGLNFSCIRPSGLWYNDCCITIEPRFQRLICRLTSQPAKPRPVSEQERATCKPHTRFKRDWGWQRTSL